MLIMVYLRYSKDKQRGCVDMAKVIYDGNGVSRGIKEAYEARKYIVCYRAVYQPFYSEAQDSYYAKQVYRSSVNLVGRGRYIHATGDHANRLIDKELLRNL